LENRHATKYLGAFMQSYHAFLHCVHCVLCRLVVLLQVVYSYAFGIFFFHEHLTLFGVAGTALIAMGMACVTARTPPPQQQQQQQQQQGDKLSDAARDAAGAGLGSQMFSRILQLEPEQQQLGGSMRSSSSFLARMQSFQRLLADRRSGGEVLGGMGSVQYHAAGSGDAEGVGLLPVTQKGSSDQTAAAGAGSGRVQQVPCSLLTVEEDTGELSSLQVRAGHHAMLAAAAAAEPAGGVAHNVELVASGALQHRHVHLLQQQQQQCCAGDAVTVADDAFHAVSLEDSSSRFGSWAASE
jgi:hypothetical protein